MFDLKSAHAWLTLLSVTIAGCVEKGILPPKWHPLGMGLAGLLGVLAVNFAVKYEPPMKKNRLEDPPQ